MEVIIWQKWVGEYKDRLSAPSKTHLTEDGKVLLCGKAIPDYLDGYEVEAYEMEGYPYGVECKKCEKRIGDCYA